MSDDDYENERIQSIDSLAEKVDQQQSLLDQILAKLSGSGGWPRATAADTGEDVTSGRPPSVAEQVRAELAAAKAQEKKEQDELSAKSEAEQLRERLARLEEKKPEPSQPRRQRVMWGSR